MIPPDALIKRGILRARDNVPEQSSVVMPPKVVLGFLSQELQAVIHNIRERNDAQKPTSAATGAQ